MKTILIIDGDILSFRCAAANESRSIRVTHKVTGQQTQHAHRTAFKEHIRGSFEVDEFDVEDVQTCEDISHAYHAINTCIEAWMKSCDASSYEVYVSGDDNFRDSLPLPTKYKSNRTGIKPLQLSDCREYLVKKYKAKIVHGREVDDMLAQRCYEGLQQKIKTVAVTIDGDQQGVAGWMYNWTKMREPKLVTGLGEIELVKDNKDFDGYGRKFYYAQWVLGDATDCFKPCELAKKKFGVVAMYNLLKDCKTDKECVEAVYNQYKIWYPEPTTYTAWEGTEHTKSVIEIMDMYAACAHMKRFEDDVFDTKKLLDKLEIKL
jgi:hypothetical protein